ncbi:hypothetical protein [Azospirillum sp. sgz302134]
MAQDVVTEAPDGAAAAPTPQQRRRFRRSTSHAELKRRINTSTARVVNGRFSIPVIEEAVTLRSLESQRIVESCYRRAMRSLFNLDVILAIIDRSADATEVWKVVDAAVAAVLKAVTNERKRLETVQKNRDVTREMKYSLSVPVTFQISSASALDFCQIVRELDDTIALLDLLTMLRVVPRADRRQIAEKHVRAIEGLTNRIVGIERRAFESATRMGKATDLAGLETEAAAPAGGEAQDVATKEDAVPADKAPGSIGDDAVVATDEDADETDGESHDKAA